tara:strand:+ start:384 stop:2225 length:1842 start_codon:yes stop_codon:yes gene_type:complete
MESFKLEIEVDSKGAVKNVQKVSDALTETGKKGKKELNLLQKGLLSVGKAGKKIANGGLKAVGIGLKGIGKAYLAAGIGIIVSGFAFLTNALRENQEVMDAVNTVFETLSIIGSQVSDVIVSVYKNVASASENFDALGKVMKSLLTIAITPLKLAFDGIRLGLQSAQLAWEESFFGDKDPETIKRLNESIFETKQSLADTANEAISAGKSVVTNFGEAISEFKDITTQVIDGVKEISIEAAIETAKTNVSLKKSAELARVANQGLIEDYDRQAEQQRQIRDNDLNSIEERISANDLLKSKLEEQEKLMLENARLIQASAQAQFDKNGSDEDALILAEAKNEVKAVEAQIEGFMSEQESNRVALLKEKIELDLVNDELTSVRQAEQRAFLLEMEEGDIRRFEMALENLELENEAETKRLTQKRDIFKKGTQAYIDANNELLTYQQTNANQQTKIEKDLQKSKADALKGALSDVASLVGTSSKFGKSIAIAQAIQDTYAGADKAFAQGGIFGAISGAAIIAAGLMNVKKIVATKTPKPPAGLRGGSSPSVPTPSIPSPSTPNIQTPDFSILGTSGTNQIASALGEQAPVQAFVVSQDVTTAQSLENNIIQGASLG